jgi:pantoate--beta-alanine ligase
MKIAPTIQETHAVVRTARVAGKRIGLVPTMGALHEGHLSLVRAAKARTDLVVVSIFVNPLQFGPQEDLAKYPRTVERDCGLLEQAEVDLVFAPSTAEMYPAGTITLVEVKGLTDRLDGVSRPGHFRGVTTVVAKLFHIIEPDLAFFGQKDAAQSAIIRQMVKDLNFPIGIVICPIVREPDGLAMSSRNAYLSAEQRRQGLVLSRALRRVEQLFTTGERDVEHLVAAGKEVMAAEPGARLEYLLVVDPDTLEPVQHAGGPMLVAVAAWIGSVRLIDNVILRPR